MSCPRTRASQAAAGLTALTSVLHLFEAWTGNTTYVIVLHLCAGALGAVVAMKLARDNCFESRLAAAALALAGAGGVLLAGTVGLPALAPTGFDAGDALPLAAGVLVPALLVMDARRRQQPDNSPYAS